MQTLFQPILLVGLLASIMTQWGCAVVSDLTCAFKGPKETADVLVHDNKLGMRCVDRAKGYGDEIIPYIEASSDGLQTLNGRTGPWTIEVLASLPSPRSSALLRELYLRDHKLDKLLGLYGLAIKNDVSGLPDACPFLRGVMSTAPLKPSEANADEIQLAVRASGYFPSECSGEPLIGLLRQRNVNYWLHAYTCEALMRLRFEPAVVPLREALRDQKFYALPEAFRALISLNDVEAISLAIDRIDQSIANKNSGFVVQELAKVTGKNFKFDKGAWSKWWESQHGWKIPQQFLLPIDEQPPLD